MTHPDPRRAQPPAHWKRIAATIAVGVVLAAGSLAIGTHTAGAGAHSPLAYHAATAKPSPTQTPAAPDSVVVIRPTPLAVPPPVHVPTFDRAAHSIDDPASIWVVVNKRRPLTPVTFTPADLVDVPVPYVWKPRLTQESAAAVASLFAAGAAEGGLQFQSQSSYRGFDTQAVVYAQDVSAHGQAFADANTARPGFSEHQTGLAIDISAVPAACSLEACFGDTPQGRWLAANAWRFGFVLRYPADKTAITGYAYEPWHFRYVGVALSTEMHATGVSTLEEFFQLPAAPSY